MKTAEDDSSVALRPTDSPRRISTQNFYSFPSHVDPPFLPARSSFDIKYRNRMESRQSRILVLSISPPSTLLQRASLKVWSTRSSFQTWPIRLIASAKLSRATKRRKIEGGAGFYLLRGKGNVSKFVSSLRFSWKKKKKKRVNLNRARYKSFSRYEVEPFR